MSEATDLEPELPLDLPQQSNPPPRPRITRETYRTAAKRLLPDVLEWLENASVYTREGEQSEIEQQLYEALCACDDIDGFQVAKQLDKKSWDCNASLVEILDTAGHIMHSINADDVNAWVIANSITPKLNVGDMVKTPDGTGPISGVLHNSASYIVKTDRFMRESPSQADHAGVGIILPFEQCEPVDMGKDNNYSVDGEVSHS